MKLSRVWTKAKGAVGSIAGWATKAATMRWSGYGGQSFGQDGWNVVSPWLRSLLPGAHYDYEAEAGQLWKNSAVAIALAWIRQNFPEPRLRIMTRKGTEWVENPDHQALQWIEEPNDDYDSDTMWGAVCLSLEVDGNGYLIRGKAPNGRVGFWYAPHWQLFPRWPSDGSQFISHYEYVVDGKRTPIDKRDVIHFRTGLDPENERLGLSPLKACLREVCTDNEANNYTASILRNMGVPGVIISPESKEDEIADPKELKDLFRKEFTGDKRGGALVNAVSLRVQEIGATPEKLALDKLRKVDRRAHV